MSVAKPVNLQRHDVTMSILVGVVSFDVDTSLLSKVELRTIADSSGHPVTELYLMDKKGEKYFASAAETKVQVETAELYAKKIAEAIGQVANYDMRQQET